MREDIVIQFTNIGFERINDESFSSGENMDAILGNYALDNNMTAIADKLQTVTLVDVKLEKRVTATYSLTTYSHLNYFINGMLSVPGNIYLLNIFDVDTDIMQYDPVKKDADIEQYGLLAYDDFKDIVSEDVYNALNGKYLGVAVGKNRITWQEIKDLARQYMSIIGDK